MSTAPVLREPRFLDGIESSQLFARSLEKELEGANSGHLEDNMDKDLSSAIGACVAPDKYSSRSSNALQQPTTFPGIYPATQVPEDTFAEQFKYLICSSGLLEKDYVPGLSDSLDATSKMEKLELWAETRKWLERGKERWDLTAAVACVVLGLVLVLGVWAIGGILLLVLVTAAGVYVWQRYHGSSVMSSQTPPITPKTKSLTSLKNFLSQSHSLNIALSASLDILKPYLDTLNAHQELRLALHRSTDSMADHIATATSTLLEMADKKELAVLGEMYDIPVVGNFFYSRRKTQEMFSSEDELHRQQEIPSPRRTNLRPLSTPSPGKRFGSFSSLGHSHSRRSQHLSIMSMPDPNDRFTQIPERTPRLSKRASIERTKTRNSWVGDMRSERRITEAVGIINHSSGHGEDDDRIMVQPVTESMSPITSPEPDKLFSPQTPNAALTKLRPVASPFKHIPSPLSRRAPELFATGVVPLRTAPLASETRGSSFFSPLPDPDFSPSSRLEELFERGSDDDPGRKRKSLQNMLYYPSSDEDREMKGVEELTRRSMPVSDLQTLRTARTVGSRARRPFATPSIVPTGLGLGLPNTLPFDKRSSLTPNSSPLSRAPLQRITSVSPLTTPALIASSLGIHLKRRRMACCLLGLQFTEKDDSYWEELDRVLNELSENMGKERLEMEKALKGARKELEIRGTLDDLVGSQGRQMSEMDISPVEAIFPLTSLLGQTNKDFAPRTGDEQLLMEHVDKMMESIAGAWGELVTIRASISEAQKSQEQVEKWNMVRKRLGEVVRHWERGKDVVVKLDRRALQVGYESSEFPDEDIKSERSEAPDFVQTWKDSPTTENTSLGTERHSFSDDVYLAEYPTSSHVDDPSLETALPPPGKDIVFESVSAPIRHNKVILSNMSRQDRIQLTKKAREKGVRVEDLLEMGENIVMGCDDEVRKRSGQVVNELEEVIDAIRRMKAPEQKDQAFEKDERDAKIDHEEVTQLKPSSPSSLLPLQHDQPPALTSSTPTSTSILIPKTQSKSDLRLGFDIGELRQSFKFPAE
nr:hypothetical protein L203_00243 [Cryptococcus depauperatus CBS 7841]